MVWAELNDAAAEHGLAVTGGAISTTGIGGYTLGGGLGWLMAKVGLAADNVFGFELVTADGEVLDVSADSHPDLFWALRGGGGNFGVVTSFTYRLHPLQTVVGGLIAHPIDAAGDMLRFYRDAVAGCSDDLTVFAGLVHAPDGSGMKLAALVVFHTGEREAAERELAPFKSWGSPLMVEVGPMPYPVMNTILDAAYPAGSLNYWLSSFTRGMPDELIDIAVDRFATVPSPMTGDAVRALPRRGHARRRDRDGRAAPRGRLELPDPVRLGRSRRHTRERRLDEGHVRRPAAAFRRGALAQLPRRRPGGRCDPGRLRPELRSARGGQAPLRPRQRLPPEPQHRAVGARPRGRGSAAEPASATARAEMLLFRDQGARRLVERAGRLWAREKVHVDAADAAAAELDVARAEPS